MTDATLPEIVPAHAADVVIPEDCFETARLALAGVDVTVAAAPVGPLRTTHVTLDRITPSTFARVKRLLAPVGGIGVVSFSMGRAATPTELLDVGTRTARAIGHDPIGSHEAPGWDAARDLAASASAIVAAEEAFIASTLDRDAQPMVVLGAEAAVTVPEAALDQTLIALAGFDVTVGVMPDLPAAAIHLANADIAFDSISAIVDALAGMPDPLHVVLTAPDAMGDSLSALGDLLPRRGSRMGLGAREAMEELFGGDLMTDGRHRRLSEYRLDARDRVDMVEMERLDLPPAGFDFRSANDAPRSQRRSRQGRGRGGRR